MIAIYLHRTVDVLTSSYTDAASTDPGLLRKHSIIRSYTVPSTGITYPSIRVFFHPHPHGQKLPTKPHPIPLLVFVHGLGGSVAQFHPLLTSLVNVAPCLSIDLPGCGLSEFKPKAWGAYTTHALVQLLAVAIEQHLDEDAGQKVVLVGHSMGCSLAALLASATSPYSHLLSKHVIGLVAICPQAGPPDREQTQKFKKLLAIPGPVFDLWRRWDRRGGTESASVRRFVGSGAEEQTKRLQVRFNEQSKTPVWRRMARGVLPDYSSGIPTGGIPGRETWSGLDIPVFLAAGEEDHVTPPGELKKIAEYLGKTPSELPESSERGESVSDSAAPIDSKMRHDSTQKTPQQKPVVNGLQPVLTNLDSDEESTVVNTVRSNSIPSATETTLAVDGSHNNQPNLVDTTSEPQSPARHCSLKTIILPAPAAHALLYAPSTVRTLAGLIQDFLADHVDNRLSLGWQLQYLTTEGKWDVKNLAKWKAIAPVSEPIANVFRAMKTLREVDEKHSPKVFVKDWHDKIRAVVDISHESPVYNPKGLEEGGIEYHKFPTVSKLPPTSEEVRGFIALIDQLRSANGDRAAGEAEPLHDRLLGVHCHYGFNRTGFFVVCYLVERLGYKLQDAIEEFRKQRPPGIRHEHFIDTLHVRYCIGLQRAPTL
jgi:pimeloyl-ACP methyl ester carboxylesterase/protein-tyrosine phosphatase